MLLSRHMSCCSLKVRSCESGVISMTDGVVYHTRPEINTSSGKSGHGDDSRLLYRNSSHLIQPVYIFGVFLNGFSSEDWPKRHKTLNNF